MSAQNLNIRVLLLAMLFGVLLSLGCRSYPHSTPEKLGKSVYKMMKRQDPNALAALVATAADLEAFLATADLPEDERVYFKNEISTIIEDYQGQNYLAYQNANNVLSAERILFSKAKLLDMKVEISQGLDNRLCKIVMDCISEGHRFLIFVDEAGEVESGWVLGEKSFHVQLPQKAEN